MAISIVLDVGGTNIKMAMVQEGRVMHSLSIPVEDNHALEPILPDLEKHINSIVEERSDETLRGIGMAFPCIVDSRNNRILSEYVKYQDINDLNLAAWTKKNWGVPVQFENDARAALVGEWQYGAGKGINNLVQVTIGTGVGSAVLMNGRLLRGAHFLAGNLGGHMTLNYDGAICNCGNIGCVETEASTWALPEIARSTEGFENSHLADADIIDFKAIFHGADIGDELSIRIKDQCIRAWGFALINLIHAFDPECIIVSGGIAASSDILFPVFRNMINKHTWLPPDTVELKVANHTDTAALFGLDYLIKNN